jgi:CDP-2,3-bis-(O-geranylgeranyl)-sn-glycerol synthase
MWPTPEHLLLLLLLLLANGSPLIVREILGSRFARPLDGGLRLADDRPLFGETKTIRGFVAALVTTPLASALLGLGWEIGLLIGLFAMLGDLFSSFVKRRLGMPSSSRALGLDQVPESLFPLLACRTLIELAMLEVVVLVVLFSLSELLLSRVAFWLGIRKHPY